MGFNAGSYAENLEAMSDDAIVADAMSVLTTMYGPSIPQPTDVLITRWNSDPYSYGSYSSMGVNATVASRQALAQPIENRIFFAGEATSIDYSATVHGALLSGLLQAVSMGLIERALCESQEEE